MQLTGLKRKADPISYAEYLPPNKVKIEKENFQNPGASAEKSISAHYIRGAVLQPQRSKCSNINSEITYQNTEPPNRKIVKRSFVYSFAAPPHAQVEVEELQQNESVLSVLKGWQGMPKRLKSQDSVFNNYTKTAGICFQRSELNWTKTQCDTVNSNNSINSNKNSNNYNMNMLPVVNSNFGVNADHLPASQPGSDYNSFNFWRPMLPDIEDDLLMCNGKLQEQLVEDHPMTDKQSDSDSMSIESQENDLVEDFNSFNFWRTPICDIGLY